MPYIPVNEKLEKGIHTHQLFFAHGHVYISHPGKHLMKKGIHSAITKFYQNETPKIVSDEEF